MVGKHPHGRGEDKAFVKLIDAAIETPPRAWGRHAIGTSFQIGLRNTPTGVGKTFVGSVCFVVLRKHPHGRGEDFD